MIWPGVLVRCALLNAMHSNYGKKETKHTLQGERFLYLTILGSFLYFLAPRLSVDRTQRVQLGLLDCSQ